MRAFIFLFVSFFGLIFFHSRGQSNCTLSFTGKIVSEENEPLVGATISLDSGEKGSVANVSGTFALANLCSGQHTYEIKYLGYKTITGKIEVSVSAQQDFKMVPNEKVLNELVVIDEHEHVQATNIYTTLSAHELDQNQGKPLGEILKNITGVNSIQTGPAIFKPVIHGVHSQRILILNNGIRQEGQSWGAEHAPEIDPFIASKVVVIKDAGAIKYGTDALGGVILINPADLPRSPGFGGKFHLIGSSNGGSGTFSGMLEGGSEKWQGFGWRVQGTGKRAGDSRAASYNLSNTGFQELNFSTAAGIHKSNFGLEGYFSHFETKIGILSGAVSTTADELAQSMESEPPRNTRSFTYKIGQPRQEVSHDLIKLNAHWERGLNLFHFQYGLQINNRKEFDQRRGNLREIPALGFKLYTHTIDLEWERNKNKGWSTSAGATGMIQDNNKIDGTQTIPFIPNFSNLSGGVYIIEKKELNRWAIDFGARYDFRHYDIVGFDFNNRKFKTQTNFNSVTATAGASYRINSKNHFTTNIGTTWRPPNMAELYSQGTHQSAASIEYGLLLDETTSEIEELNTSNFNVEQAAKWVASYHYQTGKIEAEAQGYVNYIFNYIFLKPRGVTQTLRGVSPYFHYAQTDASFMGIDFSSAYGITDNWMVKTKASLLRATDEGQNDFLIFIPPNRYDVALRYEKPKTGSWKNFYGELRIRYSAYQNRAPKRIITPTQFIEAKSNGIDLLKDDQRNFDFMAPPPAYFLLGLSAGVSRQIKNSQLEIRLTNENLLNQSCREYTNRMRYFADEIGRNISLGVTFSF